MFLFHILLGEDELKKLIRGVFDRAVRVYAEGVELWEALRENVLLVKADPCQCRAGVRL
jgi:hypothetical protein